MVRGFEVDERSTAPEPLRPFTDLPQDGSYESQRARVRRQTALLEEYERHQVDARHRRADTLQNGVLIGDILEGRIIPPSDRGLLRPMRRASIGSEVVVNRPPPSRQQQGHDAAKPRTHGDGYQQSENPNNQQQPSAGPSTRINYDKLLRRSDR